MRILFFLFVTYLLSACNSKTPSEEHVFKNITADSILLQNILAKTKALNLPPINFGVDRFELRIWHGLSIATPKILVTLKYQDSAWHLTHTDYWLTYQWSNGSPDKVLLDSSFTRSSKATSDIYNIIHSIYRFRLDTFPSQQEIPGFQEIVADGVFYQIEIATPNFYKAILYSNPNRYNDPHNKGISRFILMLNDIGIFSMP